MRRKALAILCVVFLLSGCKKVDNPLGNAIGLRNKVLKSNGCSFSATVTADYGEKVYAFSMDCESDVNGNLNFCVTKPGTIAGITGNISAAGGNLTFDDKVLAFHPLADGEISPVTAPWLFLKTLRSGYIRSCTDSGDSYQVEIDDSYAEDALRLLILIENDLPVKGEIFWKGRRVIAIAVEHFIYL